MNEETIKLADDCIELAKQLRADLAELVRRADYVCRYGGPQGGGVPLEILVKEMKEKYHLP